MDTSAPYKPSKNTLFLDPTFTNISWSPPKPIRRGINLAAAIAKHGGDVHAYFVSKEAASHAASDTCSAAMYRHIGAVSLKGLKVDHDIVLAARHSNDEYVNLCDTLRVCEAKNKALIDSLYSLTEKYQDPYPAPYIVALADRKHFLSLSKDGTDIVAQLYVGRLLFELIAYADTKCVFANLIPSVPFEPLPSMPVHPDTLGKSPVPSGDDSFTLSGLLRRAETAGYACLTDEQRGKVQAAVNVKLYPFQEQTVRWMIDKEDDQHSINQYFWEERGFTRPIRGSRVDRFYYFPLAGELRLSKPPEVRGGMVTEEMGLGKTVEALALVAAQKSPHRVETLSIRLSSMPPGASIDSDGIVNVSKLRHQNQDTRKNVHCPLHFGDEVLSLPNRAFPKTVKVRRSLPRSTLVLCPKSLIAQWKQEAEMRAPSLSVVEWKLPTRESDGTPWSAAVGEQANDVVLATYEMLLKDPLLSKICWRRLVLDEAQVTRRSTSQVARDTFNLRAESRFLMTGTPIVSDIDDLRGELSFLRVWPFTLNLDGFWESQIRVPFMIGHSTALIDHLLSVTMTRHTKAQNLSLELPPRTYETIEVELSGSHRAIYCFVVGCCFEELETWSPHAMWPRYLRTLLKLVMSTCVSPSLLSLTQLDLARRSVWSRSRILSSGASAWNMQELRKVTPTEAIQFLAETGRHIARGSNRRRTTLRSAGSLDYEQFLSMDTKELFDLVKARGLLPVAEEGNPHTRLAQLAAGGVHRLTGDTLEQLQNTVVTLGIRSADVAANLSRSAATAILVRHFSKSGGAGGTSSAHEAGFAALTRLIEKNETPSCPVCLAGSMERVSMTKCGHFYCVDCFMVMLRGGSRSTKCAICRRDVTVDAAVEVQQPQLLKDAEEEALPEDKAAEEECVAEGTKQKLTFVYRSDINRYSNAKRPTKEELWADYEQIGQAPARYRSIGRNPEFPSLDPEFLRHVAAVASPEFVSPKLFALRSLIRSCSEETKFCVVAETERSLRGISKWLGRQGIQSVGVGSSGWSGSSKDMGVIAKQFSSDRSIRVFLLNAANASGLTLTAARYVVLMEPMLRLTDEMQAAARVHRIGQTHPVKVVRIIAKNTIEEQIMYRRGEIRTPEQETEALLGADRRETPFKDLIRLFRDLRDWENAAR